MAHARVHYAVYGQVRMLRAYCESCDGMALIIDGKFGCCGERFINEDEPTKTKRMCEVAQVRVGPSAKYRKMWLEANDYRCYWCFRRFGATVYRHSKPIKLHLHWDHVEPWVYSQDNRDKNFVGACHVCNGIKSCLIFKTYDEARIAITAKWEEKGYRNHLPDDNLPGVQVRISPETPVTEILQQ